MTCLQCDDLGEKAVCPNRTLSQFHRDTLCSSSDMHSKSWTLPTRLLSLITEKNNNLSLQLYENFEPLSVCSLLSAGIIQISKQREDY
jgi:hypothetical protein